MLDDIDRLNFLNERGKIQLRFEEEIDYACGFSDEFDDDEMIKVKDILV